jgi:hypothetical protein
VDLRPRELSSALDGRFGFEPRLIVQLVDDVPVSSQRQPRVVAELAGHVDDASALVEEQAGK